jgi:capsular polysaccharide biosynthesis protein
MEYIDTFRHLNSHLCTPALTPLNIEKSYSAKRKGVQCSEATKQNLKQIFKFSDNLFKDHDIHFKNHNVVSLKVGERGFTILHVGYKWSNTYFHFLTEALPSILSIQRSEPIVCLKSSFCVPILRWFGIQNQIIHDTPKYTKEIITQEFIECGNPSLQKIQLLRSVIEQKVCFEKKIGILIYRRENYRKILNHDEVLHMLTHKYPQIEWHVFDVLPIEKTAELFSKARVIAGPHGAGFTNMIFAPKGIDIIEFMDIEHPNVCYWHMSEMLGNTYHMIECKTTNLNFTIPPDCNLPTLDIYTYQ